MQTWKNLLLGSAGQAGSGGEPLTFRDSDTDTANLTDYTFSDMYLGDAYSGRSIVIAIGHFDDNDIITGVTVGGVSATEIAAETYESGSFRPEVAIYAASYPSGTSADVVVSLNQSSNGMAIGVWSVGGTVAAAAPPVVSTGSSSYSNVSLTIPSGGSGIFVTAAQNGDNPTITGDATKRFGLDSNSNEWISGSSITEAGSSSSSFSLGGTNSIVLGQALTVGEGVDDGGGVEPTTYIGATSASGASSLNASDISGETIGDTYILAAMDDNTLETVSSSGWDGMSLGFPTEENTNSIAHIVCTKSVPFFGNNIVSFEVGSDSHTVDAICAVAFRNMGTPPSTPTATQSTSSSSFSLPSMTVSQEGSTAVIIAMIDDDDATISSVPTGYTLAVQDGRLGGSLAIMYQLDMPAGATGTISGSWSSSDNLLTYGYIIPPA